MTTEWYNETFEGVRFGLRTRSTLLSTQSEFQKIEILDTEAMGIVLVIDGVFMTSEKDEHLYHEMIVHPALVTAPRIADVLIIGGGDGGTAREALRHDVERVTMVEIDGDVVEACKKYLPSLGAWDDERLDLKIADGIRFVAEADAASYDIVLLDGCDPVGPSEGLFNADFYKNVRRVLRPSGVFALQSESHLLMPKLWTDIQLTLRRIFGAVHPYFGSVPIYGAGNWSWTFATDSVDPLAIDLARLERIERGCRHYNRDIHRGAFAQPNDVRRLLG